MLDIPPSLAQSPNLVKQSSTQFKIHRNASFDPKHLLSILISEAIIKLVESHLSTSCATKPFLRIVICLYIIELTGEKPYNWEMCPQASVQNSNLICHKQTQLWKPYRVSCVPMPLLRIAILWGWPNVHRWKCLQCPKAFPHINYQTFHADLHMQDNLTNDSNVRVHFLCVPCGACAKSLDDEPKSDYINHWQSFCSANDIPERFVEYPVWLPHWFCTHSQTPALLMSLSSDCHCSYSNMGVEDRSNALPKVIKRLVSVMANL